MGRLVICALRHIAVIIWRRIGWVGNVARGNVESAHESSDSDAFIKAQYVLTAVNL